MEETRDVAGALVVVDGTVVVGAINIERREVRNRSRLRLGPGPGNGPVGVGAADLLVEDKEEGVLLEKRAEAIGALAALNDLTANSSALRLVVAILRRRLRDGLAAIAEVPVFGAGANLAGS